jgi:uncharacterized protein with PhoU and TrkA domain
MLPAVNDKTGGNMKKRKRFEEIGYEPTNVKELLTEMKDVSELITDLAYSAIIFDSKEIAEEVKELESRMDKLLYQIRLTAMLATRTMEDAEQFSGLLQVASAAENISNAAGDIIKLLDTKIENRPFLSSLLQKADEKIRIIHVPEKSPMSDKTILELNVEAETGVRIIAIKKGEKWIYDPSDNTSIKGSDMLIVRGVNDGYIRLKEFAEGKGGLNNE